MVSSLFGKRKQNSEVVVAHLKYCLIFCFYYARNYNASLIIKLQCHLNDHTSCTWPEVLNELITDGELLWKPGAWIKQKKKIKARFGSNYSEFVLSFFRRRFSFKEKNQSRMDLISRFLARSTDEIKRFPKHSLPVEYCSRKLGCWLN